MKSPVMKGLGGEREGFRRGGPLAIDIFSNAKFGFIYANIYDAEKMLVITRLGGL